MEEEKLAVMDVREMVLKCTTKAEVYKVLVTSGGIYLPSVDQINGDYIRDILTGDKLVRHLYYVEVCWMKQSKNHRSSSFRWTTHSWTVRIRREALSNQKIHAWLSLWKVSISKMDMKCQ